MPGRSEELIELLNLEPHPEGGYFKEVFRSPNNVQPQDDRPLRSALTVIYFLLQEGDTSKWHRVRSDEAWHFLEGDPLQLYMMDDKMEAIAQKTLYTPTKDHNAVEVVPANTWQAAECTGNYALVSCSVGPGFDFEDFEMMNKHRCNELQKSHPDFAYLV